MCPMETPYFFFNDTATTEIYTLSLHDALPILIGFERAFRSVLDRTVVRLARYIDARVHPVRDHHDEVFAHRMRSEEHTSELQSPDHLVCLLLLEKKNYD